ncbi:MAG: hypothetical protein AB7G75_34070, partial [Candidatus Binatia bacterium]
MQMIGHGEKLSRKMEVLIAALLTEPTVTQAAMTAGIAEATARRWLQLPHFQAQYRAARREAVTQAISRLQQASAQAVSTLEAVMTDGESPAAARVTAAKTTLDLNQTTEDWHRDALADTSRVVRPLNPSARSFCAKSDDSGYSP